MPSRDQIAWAAGVFEGEGCFTRTGRNTRSRSAAINMTDEDIVRRFHEIVGVGQVYGPYKGKTKGKDFWQWKAAKFEHFQYIVALFWDYLGTRRKAKATELLKEYHAVL